MADFAFIGGVVYALTELAKYTGLPTRYAPLFALIMGVLMALAIAPNTWLTVLEGGIAALTVMGLYSGTKSTFKVQ